MQQTIGQPAPKPRHSGGSGEFGTIISEHQQPHRVGADIYSGTHRFTFGSSSASVEATHAPTTSSSPASQQA